MSSHAMGKKTGKCLKKHGRTQLKFTGSDQHNAICDF